MASEQGPEIVNDEFGAGIRFYYWLNPADTDEEEEASGYGKYMFLTFDADQFAEQIRLEFTSIVGVQTQWDSVPTGGAGETGIVEIISATAAVGGLIYNLLNTPGAALKAWNCIRKLLGKLDENKSADWHASSEAAILRCLANIQDTCPDAYTDPSLVRVIQDGKQMGVWADMPIGLHFIVIPELRERKTHLFSVTSKLDIVSHNIIDRLTYDAKLVYPEENKE